MSQLKTFLILLVQIGTIFNAKTGKFLGFEIGLVRFANSICTSGDGLEGVCYTRRECNRVGGIGSGYCASGIGVCCIVQKSCTGITTSNNTYFTNPGFPNSYQLANTCSLTIRRLNKDICQVRIDFTAFSLDQPNSDGLCTNEGLTITGGASTVPTICGENSGQHIYIDFPENGDIQMNVYTSSLGSSRKTWNFKVAQIGCDCPTKAPSGCLMYYNSLSGTVKSFNYGTTGNVNSTRQLANQNYGVCVGMQPGFCSINWAQTTGDLYSFTVTNDTSSAVAMGMGSSSISGDLCTTDYVLVPNPTFTANQSALNVDRFCGNSFEPITTSSKPFVLTVVNDDSETDDLGNRGFSLDFSQQRCIGVPMG